jgi:hypothetical protein
MRAAGALLWSLVLTASPASAAPDVAMCPGADRRSGPIESQARVEACGLGALLMSDDSDRQSPAGLTLKPAAASERAERGQWSPLGVQHRPLNRKAVFGVLGAIGGFFLGGVIGAAIEGRSCACDDPGLKGWTIGAPVGAIVGGALAVKLAGR